MRMPAIFFGHGNPMNALQRNAWTEKWAEIGRKLPRPRAILSISAHWYVEYTGVTAMPAPRTIHDFGGFPRELYQVQYPAPGAPDLAEKIRVLLAPVPVHMDQHWGLDHGTWSVLVHVFPEADVPVIQLGLDETQPAAFHYALAKQLRSLREEGVLILGSGNMVHNLHTYAWGSHSVEPFDWLLRFEKKARELMLSHQHEPLVEYETLGKDALLSIPTPEHFLPLLYVLAQREEGEAVTFPVEGSDGGSISMLAVQVG